MKKLAILLPVMLLFACQQAVTGPEYVKYESDAAVPRISAEEAKKEYDAGRAVFVDTRGEGAWKIERLPGALEISSSSPDEKLDSLPKGKKIITYCS